ncbi:MAG TPA: isochorismatase family cysteine hydrolase [Caulobacteraceae bacterium]|nr:isochorismatase family cysteine hydrolase [Caulobacteraceae bacterium]
MAEAESLRRAHSIHSDWIRPSRTALLIIDMQADFASPEGAAARGGASLDMVPSALTAADRLARAARAAGALVAFALLETAEATDSPVWSERLARTGRPRAELAICRSGQAGAAPVGPQPAPRDLVVRKRRYSAFFDTGLDAALEARAIDTLVVCGLTTECCIDSSVREACHRDYHVFVVADACASYDERLHRAALEALALHCAIVVNADEVSRAWVGRGGQG